MFKKHHLISAASLIALSMIITIGLFHKTETSPAASQDQTLSGQIAHLQQTLRTIDPSSVQSAVLINKIQKLEKLQHGIQKTNQPDMFAKFQNDIRLRDGRQTSGYKLNFRYTELKKALRRQKKFINLHKTVNSASYKFIERGPHNVPGRVRGLLVDQSDASHNTWLAGAVGGGIWKTTDGGATWVPKTENLPILSISYFASPASDPAVIYAGTGEGFFNVDAVGGNGILKSTDHGETWTLLPATMGNPQFASINRLIVDPNNADVVLSCSNGSGFSTDYRTVIMKSTDGGASWSQKYQSNNRIQHLIANPENFNTQYASVNGVGVIKSTDGGETWKNSTGILSGLGGRLELAISPTDTNTVYAAAEGANNNSVLYVTFNGGKTWALANDTGSNPNWLNGQGWYDNTIMVDPNNSNAVFVGGVQLYKITLTDTSVSATTENKVYDIVRNNTTDFLNTVNFSNKSINGFYYSDGKDENATNLADSDFVSVELRFGPGHSQKAHRFTVPDGSTSGVPPSGYSYVDYVDVPFEVWDITHNRQLMVSFRDQDKNGEFDYTNDNESRQYVFISGYTYDPDNPNPGIAQAGGYLDKLLYFYWPVTPTATPFDKDHLPAAEADLQILYGEITNYAVKRSTTLLSAANNIHVDNHNLKSFAVDGGYGILNANDGGVAFSLSSGNSWQRSLGINSTQYYGADKKPGANIYLAGAQDNGTWYSPADPDSATNWNYAQFSVNADGFEVVWNFNKPDYMIGSWQNGNLERSTDGGKTWAKVRASSGSDPFITKIAGSQIKPDLLFTTGGAGVYKSSDFGKTWHLKSIDANGWVGGSSYSNIAISLANPNIVWAGGRMSSSGKLFVSIDEGENFKATKNYQTALGALTGITTHPFEDSTAYALFSIQGLPKILKTTDLGQTWTDISGFEGNTASDNGFPDVAVYDLFVMPFNTDIIWAGTEIGLFESTDGAASWHLAPYNIPAVSIWQIKEVEDQLVIATHGRGVWSVTIPELTANRAYAPLISGISQQSNGDLKFDLKMRFKSDSTVIMAGGNTKLGIIGPVSETTDTSLTVVVPAGLSGNKTITFTSYNAGKSHVNGQAFKITATSKPDIAIGVLAAKIIKANLKSYLVSDIKLGTSPTITYSLSDASGTKISESTNGMNLISGTKYVYSAEYKLSAPGKLDISATATNQFGVSSQVSASYNIASLTKNSARKISLRNGQVVISIPAGSVRENGFYLASFSGQPAILEALKTGQVVDENRYGDVLNLDGNAVIDDPVTLSLPYSKEWMTDLRSRYDNFKEENIGLYSYQDGEWHYVGGEGQQGRVEATTSAYGALAVRYNPDHQQMPHVFALYPNYPNPFNPTTTIRFELPEAARVTLTIYNMLGQKVRTLVNGNLEAGFQKVVWNGTNVYNQPVASGLYLYSLESGNKRLTRKMLLVK